MAPVRGFVLVKRRRRERRGGLGGQLLERGQCGQLVPAADLDKVVHELASTIAANAPLTILATKVIVAEAAKDPAERDIALCDELVENCMLSEDYKEGRTAFLEKRPPIFKGK